MIAADYSHARPSYQALRDAGYKVIFRYLGEYNDSRCITPNELAGLHGAGFMVAVIFETSASRPLSGRDGGRADAVRANAWADRLGVPWWVPIFYAVDFSPSAAQLPTVADYFRGVLESGGRPIGMYGSYDVVEYLNRLSWAGRRVEHYWQCAAWSGSGNGTGGSIRTGYRDPVRLSAAVCAFQHYGLTGSFGSSIDHNDVLNGAPSWAWHPSITAPDHEERDMANKAVFCPDQTGGIGWQALAGRTRAGISSQEELAMLKEIGDVDGEVTLRGGAGQLFLEKYVIPTGPPRATIARPKATSAWADEVGLAPGDRPRFLLIPGGLIVRIADDSHANLNLWFGAHDAGELDDGFFFSGSLQPWVLRNGSELPADLLNQVRDAAAEGVDSELDKAGNALAD